MTAESPPVSNGPRPLRFGRWIESGEGVAARWLLKRNCSLAPRQLITAFALLAAVTLGIGLLFLSQGAPFVLPFAGLELAALGTAFWYQARHAADCERLDLEAGRLRVERCSGADVQHFEFAAAALRVDAGRAPESLIELRGHGRQATIGRFVRAAERHALADELRATLAVVPWSRAAALA